MSKVIVITSGKGGVGKSNICINTALRLSALNYRTCLFDADLGLANANILLGLEQEYTLDDVIFNDKGLKDIILRTPWGFDIIPGSSGVEKIANLSGTKLNQLVRSFSQLSDYDYFLIDTASGISQNVISFCLPAHETVIVLTPEATSLTDAYALLKVLDANNYKGSVRILVNNCSTVQLAKKTYSRYKKVVDKHLTVSVSPAGIILRDPCFEKAVSQQKPLLELYPQSVAATCIHAFASNIVEEWDVGTEDSSLATFWQRYLQTYCLKTDTDPKQANDIKNSEEEPGTELSALDTRQAPPVPTINPDEMLYTEEQTPSALPSGTTYVDGKNGMTVPGYTQQWPSHSTNTDFNSPKHILHKAFQLISQGTIAGPHTTDLILNDPALTLQALKLASLVPGSHGDNTFNLRIFLETSSLSKIRSMLLKAIMDGAFSQPTVMDEPSLIQFWQQSKCCAILANELAIHIKYPFPDDAYLCGLLLNIGKFPFAASATDCHHDDHAATGANILRSLPVNTMICDGVHFHHYPEEQIKTAFDLVRIVYVANQVTKEQEPRQTLAELFDDITIEDLATMQRRAKQVVQQARDEYSNSDSNLAQQLMNYLFIQGIMPPVSTVNHVSDCLKAIVNSIQTLFGFKHIICFLLDSHKTTLEVKGASGDHLHHQLHGVKISMEVTDCLLVKALTTGDIEFLDTHSVTEKTCLMDQQLNRILGNTGVLGLPLKEENRAIGVLACSIDKYGLQAYTAKQEQLLQLATQATRDLAELSRTALHSPNSRLDN